MESAGNQNEVTLSPEQMSNIVTLVISQIQTASPQDLNQIKEIVSQLAQNIQLLEDRGNNITQSFQQLNQITQNETQEAISKIMPIIGNEEAQKRIAKIVDQNQKLVDEFQNLPPVKKAFARSGLIGVAGAAVPIAAAGIAIAVPVALVALPLVLLYIGLKRATPSKAEFKQSWQEMKKDLVHDIKNLASKGPGETNLEKLWKSASKPGVTAENPNLKPFLEKYCFPDQNPGEKIKVKFDPDKIEALKAVVKELSLNLDIDRMVRKGESKVSGDYVQDKAQNDEDNKFIATIDKIATAVIEKHNLSNSKNPFVGMQSIFEAKLAEIKQAKATEAAAKKENSPFSRFKKSSSHVEGIKTEREESSSQGRRNSI